MLQFLLADGISNWFHNCSIYSSRSATLNYSEFRIGFKTITARTLNFFAAASLFMLELYFFAFESFTDPPKANQFQSLSHIWITRKVSCFEHKPILNFRFFSLSLVQHETCINFQEVTKSPAAIEMKNALKLANEIKQKFWILIQSNGKAAFACCVIFHEKQERRPKHALNVQYISNHLLLKKNSKMRFIPENTTTWITRRAII